jgi:diguanylate cyclase
MASASQAQDDSPALTGQEDPAELTVRLEQVGGKLMQLAKTAHGAPMADQLRECVQELRAVWSALRRFSLVFDASRVETMQDHERELRMAMEILSGTVSSLSSSQERTTAAMDERIGELDELDSVDDASLLAGRLRSVTSGIRDAATEMRADVQQSAHELAQSQEIITAVDRKLAEASHQILCDGLTRLLNRTGFEQRLAEMASQSAAVAASWSLMLIELDHIELINKKFGRRVGDALLFRVAGIIQQTCESYPAAIAARTDGRQFGILLPRCSLREARRIAEEVRAAIEAAKWECRIGNAKGVVCTTVSLGVTSFRNGESTETLMARAESCCQRARQGGGNTVVAEG